MPIELKISIPNLPNMVKAFSQDLTAPVNDVIDREYVMQLFEKVKSEAPVKTGALRDSINITRMGSEWRIESGVPYDIFVRGGTVPHDIYPCRPAYGLWWEDMRVDHPIAMAPHPGIEEPNDYAQRALDSMGGRLSTALDAVFRKIGEITRF